MIPAENIHHFLHIAREDKNNIVAIWNICNKIRTRNTV